MPADRLLQRDDDEGRIVGARRRQQVVGGCLGPALAPWWRVRAEASLG
ncbi:hypothetical protein ACFVVL_27695 [Kitasatospora sp. NPDC058115]